jgi:hypothetical protein
VLRAGLVAVGLGALVTACGGGESSQRGEVRAYLERTNAVQQRFAPDFRRADAAFKAFANGDEMAGGTIATLARAESDIRSAQDAVAALRPPARAATVHDRLLRVYAIDADLAHETLRLARYRDAGPRALAGLDRASKRLRGKLRAARKPGTQAQALATFSSAVGRTLRRLNGLDVPEILAPSHRAQVERLQTTRRLTARLRDAVRDRDSQRVAKLLLKFRAGGESLRSQRVLMREGAAAYTSRLKRLAQAQTDLGREQARLRRSVR